MSFSKESKKLYLIILGFLFCLNLFVWIYVYDLNKNRFLEINFLDIGQGDAIFIETPEKHQILIDGGPGSIILEKLGEIMPFYDRSLDLIILTHPDKDHLAGLLEVLRKYKVENIFWTGIAQDTLVWKEWKRLIKKEGAQIKIAESGQKIISKNSNNPIYLDILYPFDKLEEMKFKNSNDTSVVCRLIFGETSILFTGDITKSTERKLIDKNIDSDVLKIAHHGSNTSSSEEFLKIVSPDVAVIQVGDNNYGHPRPEVLANLNQFGIQVLRTDINGDIKMISDGRLLKIISQK